MSGKAEKVDGGKINKSLNVHNSIVYLKCKKRKRNNNFSL